MNSYKTDLENIEKRSQLRSRLLFVDTIVHYSSVSLSGLVVSSFLGFWLALIPMFIVSALYGWKVTPKVESYAEKLCKTRYPLSSEQFEDLVEQSKELMKEEKTEENPV